MPQREQPAANPAESLANYENELKLFEAGVQSEFWRTLQVQWKGVVDAATGAALANQATDRSFLAGRANGLHNFMRYPENHIKKLRAQVSLLRTSHPELR